MIDYMNALPMWLQAVIIIVFLLMIIILFAAIIKLVLVIIEKVRNAEKIKAGPGGVEIEDDPEAPPDNKHKPKRIKE